MLKKDIEGLAKRIAESGYDFRSGGKIHIKPENRGKFTALKKRTGHSASWFKAHGTPAQKKMAVFALNARKWRHDNGGLLHRLTDLYGDEASALSAIRIAQGKKFAGGGQTVSQVWKERTGKDWSEVGRYYDKYDKSLKGNLELLGRLNAGEFDYLANPQPEPVVRERRSINIGERIAGLGEAIQNQRKGELKTLLKTVDVLPAVVTPKDWRESYVGDYVYNDVVPISPFDLSQYAVPEEAHRIYGTHINPDRITEWDDYKCASFLTNWRQKHGGSEEENNKFIAENDYRGNAWDWLKHAQGAADKGADVSVDYNMYTENKFTGREGKEEVIRRTRQLSKTPEYQKKLRDNIRPGSVVTLLYPSSQMFGHASESFRSGKGTTLSTHIGDVVELDGKLYVRDNVGGPRTNYKGHIHYRPLEQVLAGKDSDGVLITGIANYGKHDERGDFYDMSKFNVEPNDRPYTPLRVASSAQYRMADAIERNREMLQKKYGITDEEFTNFEKIALGIGLKESYAGQGELYKHEAGQILLSKYLFDRFGVETNDDKYVHENNLKYAKNAFLKFGKEFAERASGLLYPYIRDPEKAHLWAESKGITNVKYRGDRGDWRPLFTEKELEELGLKGHMYDERIMESPEVSGVMSMIAIKKKRDEIQKIVKDLPESVKKDPRWRQLFTQLVFLSWNQGTRNIRKTVDRIKKGDDPEDIFKAYMNTSYGNSLLGFVSYYDDKTKDLGELLLETEDITRLPREQIESIQSELVRMGYLQEVINGRNQIDGIAGKNTKAAISKYLDDLQKSRKKKTEPSKKESVSMVPEPSYPVFRIDNPYIDNSYLWKPSK